VQGLETNDYQDHKVLRGTTFRWAFEISPLDLTGCTAVMRVTTLGDLAMTIAVSLLGPTPVSRITLTDVAAATTTTWAAGLYDYTVLVTFPGGTVLPYGTGKVLVT
jgi:hypothetical protein